MKAKHKDYDQVSGLFSSYNDLVRLLEELHTRGYREEDLSVLMSEKTRDRLFAARENTKAPEGASIGGLSGGIIGAVVGGLTLLGNILAPGVGLLVAGPLVGAITGGAIGVAGGALVGGLIGAGIPEHEAKFFENALHEEGNILLVVHVPHDDSTEVKRMFERYGAVRLKVAR